MVDARRGRSAAIRAQPFAACDELTPMRLRKPSPAIRFLAGSTLGVLKHHDGGSLRLIATVPFPSLRDALLAIPLIAATGIGSDRLGMARSPPNLRSASLNGVLRAMRKPPRSLAFHASRALTIPWPTAASTGEIGVFNARATKATPVTCKSFGISLNTRHPSIAASEYFSMSSM